MGYYQDLYFPGSSKILKSRNTAEATTNRVTEETAKLSLAQQRAALRQLQIANSQALASAKFKQNQWSFVTDYINSLQGKQDEANAANEARYAEARQMTQALRDRSLASFDMQRTQQFADIDQAAQEQAAQVGQQAYASGLTGTTVLPNLQAGVQRDRQAARNRLQSQIADERRNLDIALTGADIDLIRERSDVAPNSSEISQLLISLGQGLG